MADLDNSILPLVASATDGTQIPFGVQTGLFDIVVADGGTAIITMAVNGRVDQNTLIFVDGDSLNTPVNRRCDGKNVPMGTIEACMIRQGIIPIDVLENTVAY